MHHLDSGIQIFAFILTVGLVGELLLLIAGNEVQEGECDCPACLHIGTHRGKHTSS